ncbi:serine hydrolase domain-containing protein [Streptomyces sp. MJP52]|uniref:serine hydrolase domain-containing protein n=1 Tax=Streptomyces sp. MJP52 TaxID=2940555 RepID=UPI0024761DD3|nr:serine hydrolase domain-containing protein [Streptomyces sp. MJP52]MDH6224693.1 D-alanyl-D-alanine carboxypeptidase [Streptomyces sp. MJP52]
MPRTARSARTARATAVAAALALGLGALAVPAGAAAAAPRPLASCVTLAPGPDAASLCAAVSGLPDDGATAAQVRVGGEGAWLGTAGVRDLGSGAPAVRHARFRAGSTSKVVTASMVLQLAAEGRIGLDRPVQRYLPGLFPAEFEPMTVRQLLNHTSGLRPGASFGDTTEEMWEHRFDTLTPQEVVAGSIAAGPGTAPGEVQRYSNIHYVVLGLMIEEVTGDTFAHQAEVRIFRPLGMKDSYFPVDGDPRVRGPHNRGYERIDGRLTDVTEWNMTDRFAAGDLISSTADLETLVVSLFRGEVVPQPYLDQMFQVPRVDDEDGRDATIGLGLERFEINGQEVWGKTGSRPGYHTVVAATRDLSRTVAYSVNSTDARGDGLAIARRFAFPAFNR